MNTKMPWEMFGLTDVGRTRERNEDAVSWDSSMGLALVADGVGGRRRGEVASRLAVETIRQTLRDAALGRGDRAKWEPAQLLLASVRQCNTRIHREAAETPEHRGMASTVVAALFERGSVTISHVGDSRLYRLREGIFSLLTGDHTLVTEMVANGYLTAQEAVTHRHRNVVTRALGVTPEIKVDTSEHTTRPGDLYLLCTDGLTNLVDDAEITSMISAPDLDLRAAARHLVEAANDRGGNDNISVVLVRIGQ